MTFDGSKFLQHMAERLIHEFSFAKASGTPGLIGAAKEHPARKQLDKLMPGGVSVGSGIVIDSFGGKSRQQDIVIYENLAPVFTVNDYPESTYFPVEGVIAAGEIKSTVSGKELNDIFSKCHSVKSLKRRAVATPNGLLPGRLAVSHRNYGSTVAFDCLEDTQFDQNKNSLDQIYYFALCEGIALSEDVVLQKIINNANHSSRSNAINMISSLNSGAYYPFKNDKNSITRALIDGDAFVSSPDSMTGFRQLIKMIRLYAISGRTVERSHYERYFDTTSGSVNDTILISGKSLL